MFDDKVADPAPCGAFSRILIRSQSKTLRVFAFADVGNFIPAPAPNLCRARLNGAWGRPVNSASSVHSGEQIRGSNHLLWIVAEDEGSPIPILLFGQVILELHRAHRLALVVQKLAVERRLPFNSIELAGAA